MQHNIKINIIIQNRHPIDFKHPSNKNEKIQPIISTNQPATPNTTNKTNKIMIKQNISMFITFMK